MPLCARLGDKQRNKHIKKQQCCNSLLAIAVNKLVRYKWVCVTERPHTSTKYKEIMMKIKVAGGDLHPTILSKLIGIDRSIHFKVKGFVSND